MAVWRSGGRLRINGPLGPELRSRLAELHEMTTGKPDLSKEMADERKGKTKPEDYVAPA